MDWNWPEYVWSSDGLCGKNTNQLWSYIELVFVSVRLLQTTVQNALKIAQISAETRRS